MRRLPRVRLRALGMGVTPLTSQEVVQQIDDAVTRRERLWISNLNLHGAHMYLNDATFRDFTDGADVCLVDGWPILRLLPDRAQRVPARRVGSTDWLEQLLASGRELRVVSVGGTPRVAQRMSELVAREHPQVTWRAFPGFGLEEEATDAGVREAVASADVVLVGMGMPLQERWITQHADALATKVVASVGGCLDYFAGEQRLAPRWMGGAGLEWLYRLAHDPRRLARRYLVEPFQLGADVLRLRVRGAVGGA